MNEPIPVKDALKLIEHPIFKGITSSKRWAPVHERFWSNVRESGDGCWVWVGYKNTYGYGLVSALGTRWMVTRVMWEISNGKPIPEGLWVLHSCDYPACVTPWHLSVGTHEENMAQMEARGRSLRGSRCAHSRFTEAQVADAITRRARGESQGSIARLLGTKSSTVKKIITGETWDIPSLAALRKAVAK